jgi:hypothetical protein
MRAMAFKGAMGGLPTHASETGFFCATNGRNLRAVRKLSHSGQRALVNHNDTTISSGAGENGGSKVSPSVFSVSFCSKTFRVAPTIVRAMSAGHRKLAANDCRSLPTFFGYFVFSVLLTVKTFARCASIFAVAAKKVGEPAGGCRFLLARLFRRQNHPPYKSCPCPP